MNLPNKLTISRLAMAPLFFIAFNLPVWTGGRFAAASTALMLVLYAATELSDLLDGMIARSRNLVTDLGKVLDPFADTISRLTYFACFAGVGIMPSWTFVLILWREFSIVFVRMLMMGQGRAVAANIWGKSKAVLYAISGLAGIAHVVVSRLGSPHGWQSWGDLVVSVLFIASAFASWASFGTYLVAIKKEGSLSHLSR